MYSKRNWLNIFMLFACTAILFSCSTKGYLPQKRDNIGEDAIFNQQLFQPVLGRTTQFGGIFQPGSTTFPAQFKIVNVRSAASGQAAPELTTLYPVSVWTKAYTGNETSVGEIESKKSIQYRPVLEVGASSGDITMWSMGSSSFIRAFPDSGYVFDIEVSNTGGRRYFTGFKLQPLRERSFEPSNLDDVTGQPLTNGIHPNSVLNIIGDSTNLPLTPSDVDVFIRKVNDGTNAKNKLTFRFFDKGYNPINPDKFGATNWPGLVHGFNMTKTATSVSYDVSYPLPAIKMPTKYTTNIGDMTHTVFSYNRLDAFGMLSPASLYLDFAIYENANWEVVVVFTKDNPRFRNE
ncbi:DUF5007 domain-containing protein [Niabella sp.]|uniref:DUF5007 domain-containing protein n=1 Tax=Niabella sp. TaxID=1962976 RepID=UPI0026055275|nr:DUF5007 domain-containing protein [Niabella sp.]